MYHFLLKYAEEYPIKIVIDLNWIEVFWKKQIEGNQKNKTLQIERIKKFLCFADIIKLSKEEAILFFNSNDPSKISKLFPKAPDVIITDGSNPVIWFINSICGVTEIVNDREIIDTTGAGDAFLAGLLSQLIAKSDSNKKLKLDYLIQFASICGLLTCLGKGAIKPQPNYNEVSKFIDSLGLNI